MIDDKVLAEINRRLAADPSGDFKRMLRGQFEASILRICPEVATEPDVLEITAEQRMADAGIAV